MQTDFSNLHWNLSEIYTAIHARPGSKAFPLYASSSLDLYFQGCVTGKIAKIWDKTWQSVLTLRHPSVKYCLELTLASRFDYAVHRAYRARQKRIWNQILQINEIWSPSIQSQNLTEQRHSYKKFLDKELEESCESSVLYLLGFDEFFKTRSQPLSMEEMQGLRHTIVNFHQATYVFWSLFVKKTKHNQRVCSPLMGFLEPTSTLTDRVLFKVLKKEGRWVQMEAVMEESIPVALFAKLDDPDNLTVTEKRSLKQWVCKLNACQDSISPKLFSCILAEIMDVIRLQGLSSLTLADLLVWLDQQGCQIIHREDPAHMDWREQLSCGDTVTCNGKELVLGKQLSAEKLVDDAVKIFELEHYPDYVLKIAHNRFLLLIEDKEASMEEEHWGIRFVETVVDLDQDGLRIVSGLDAEGLCVVQEKLFNSFEETIWKSEEFELDQEDEKKALVFANHLFCMKDWKATAKNLSLSHLMWDKKGVLKSTRLLKKGPPNYNEWEAYCENAAKGNFYVLSFLMNVSKLSEHEMASYYREAVKYTLETGETDLIGRPLPKGHRQDIYDQHVKKLCKEAQDLRSHCLKHVIAHLRKKGRYSSKKQELLQQKIADRLVEFYSLSPTPGVFSDDLGQLVINSFISSFDQGDLEDYSTAADYYKDKYEWMMTCNQAALSEDDG